jgi:lysine 2,3-aminomutase
VEGNQNWTTEFARSFKNIKELYQFLDWPLSPSLEEVAQTYSLFVPRSLAKKIKDQGPNGALAREFLPDTNEIKSDPAGLVDPIGDKIFLKAPQLIHRYSSRALFAPTTICPVHCRYCFRKNELSTDDEIFQQNFDETLNYLKTHPEITEIIFTGGDPFTLSTDRLRKYLKAFSEIPSFKDVRFHTRYPVIFPERIDEELLELLNEYSNKFRTVSVAIHANHKDEFDSFADEVIKKMSRTNIQLLSQTVLLRGVNDNEETLRDLMDHFISIKVRPYYLHHPDRVKGGTHFYLPLEAGRKLYQGLRSHLPGWAIPQYVLDVPGGHGKIPAFNPETLSYSGNILTLTNESLSLPELKEE